MAERGKSVRAVGLSDKAYFLVCRWKATWSERMGAPLSWAEFLEGMANDKGTWPKQGVRPCFISGCDCANFVSPSPKKEG